MWLNTFTFYITWLLHGSCYIVFYLCLADYVSRTVEPELRASGQAMNALVISGVSRIIGSGLGGLAAGVIGLGPTFLGAAVLCSVAAVIYAVYIFKGAFGAD